MTLALALDLLLVALLAVSIATTVILSRRLAAMRRDGLALESLGADFGRAAARAEDGITHLKVSTQSLQEKLDAAQALAQDLEFLVERGGGLADRLETAVRAASRPEVRGRPTPAGSAAAPRGARHAAAAAEPRSEAERHLLAALRSAG